ncbi:MAG: endonuclease/exonuclease/phosphatase family protein [Candidatus Paceibacterota bacterium]
MKIITLNTWGGRAGAKNLLSFFDAHKDSVDVFCLQEIWSAEYPQNEGRPAGSIPIKLSDIQTRGLQEITAVLSNHVPYFRPHYGDNYGLLMLVRKDIKVLDEGELFVHKHKGYAPTENAGLHARNIQYITLKEGGETLTVINFHGLWNGKGKTDSEDRLIQSKNILAFTKTLKNEFILCGDFNLLPDTKSLSMFEEDGLRNLIKEHGITSTRTSFYPHPVRYADYVFTTKNLAVKEFRVLPEEVSDHSAILIEVK